MKKFYIIFLLIFFSIAGLLFWLDHKKRKDEASKEAVKKYEQELQEIKDQVKKDSMKLSQ